MAATATTVDRPSAHTDFQRHPDGYLHWKLSFDGPVATLVMDVRADRPWRPGYELKLNSYDLGVDLELADAVQRLRFEHPQVRSVLITGGKDRVFCAGANIPMLGTSSHGFKVNFCKFTNETRCSIEDAQAHSDLRFLAACNGATAGGGYELAIACGEIWLVDNGDATVALPEVPLLGVLPGTGGLTRLVDKRKIRRDHADVFSTLAEGLKAKRAKAWGFIDDSAPTSKFADAVRARARALANFAPARGRATAQGITLGRLEPRITDDRVEYRHVTLVTDRDRRLATLTVRGPAGDEPATAAALHAAGDRAWALAAFRELDDAILRLRFDEPEIGLVILQAEGDPTRVHAVDAALAALRATDWLADEIVQYQARVLRRLDLTAKSLYAVAGPGTAFAGVLAEVALAADRVYACAHAERPARLELGPLSAGALPMSNGLTRLQSRFLADPDRARRLMAEGFRGDAAEALEAGLVTVAPDELDWEDEVRVAIEERLSLSPDALTGMEASLRFGGPETMDSKIYGRLSAWQNWIFIRPNATGERGALTCYGKPEQAVFDWKRT
jgi:benzoyl-CoA-dihydrodiol lyase